MGRLDFNAQLPMSTEVREWLAQLENARKREEDFRKEGRRILSVYEAEKKEKYQFNILYSNTETLSPALYNNLPRPVVQRRFKDDNVIGLAAAQTTQRALSFLLDSNDSDYSNFDDMMKQAVLEALLPGRGLTRFKYEATFRTMPQEPVEVDADGDEAAPQATVEHVSSETVCGEEVPWDRVLFGYAKKWKDVPWLAFEHFFSKDELADNFGKDVAATIPLTVRGGKDATEGEDSGAAKVKEAEGEKFAHVYEIWDKTTKRVIFIAVGCGQVAKKVEDPLQLSGFYPCPRPLGFMAKVTSMTPTALYLLYEEQAEELNYITLRINKIMRALKVRGFYDSTLEGLDELMSADDNTLKPATNVAAMLQGQTLDKAIWYFPVERLVPVLQQLYLQRNQVKETIYEITGISDILRGASVASETATAQNIKNQWGTLRLKRMQKEVQRYVRDCLRIMAEIAVTKLQPQTLAAMTGLEFPTGEQKAQATMAWQQTQQQAAAIGQPAPQEPPPQIAATLVTPSWDEVLGLLRDDLHRSYSIDIETNSTVDDAATEDKELISEFMNALSQFLNGVAPLVEQGILPFEAARAMMLAITRRFRFGDEVENELKKMQPPQPKGEGDDGAAEKKQQAVLDLQMKQADAAAQQRELEMNAQLKKAESEAKMMELQRKEQLAVVEHQMRLQEMAFKNEEMKHKAMMMKQQAQQSAIAKGKRNANV